MDGQTEGQRRGGRGRQTDRGRDGGMKGGIDVGRGGRKERWTEGSKLWFGETDQMD